MLPELTERVLGLGEERAARRELAVNINRQRERRRAALRKLQEEDIAYLRQSGVLRMFEDAAAILRQEWSDASAAIDEPEISGWDLFSSTPFPRISPQIKLQWDVRLIQPGAYERAIRAKSDNPPEKQWEGRQIACSVVRSGWNHEGEIKGVQIAGEEVEKVDPERVVQAIKATMVRRVEPI